MALVGFGLCFLVLVLVFVFDRAAGAIVSEDLSEASVILGVQRPRPETLLPNRTYACFTRTIKAQRAGMPFLDAVLANNIR